jgi:hypothetical protein
MSALAESPTQETPVDSPAVEEVQDAQFDEDSDVITDFSVEIPDSPGAETAPTEVAKVEPAQEASEAEEFDAAILSHAERLGFSAEDAQAYGSRDNLQRALSALDRQASAWARAQFANQGEQFDDAPQPQAQQVPPAAQPTAQQQAAALEKFKVELDPNEWDEQQIKTFNGLNDHYHGVAEKHDATLQEYRQHIVLLASELVALKNGAQQVTGQSQAEDSASLTRDVDTFVATLGEEYTEVYGKGDYKALTPQSPQYAARQKLAEEMEVLKYVDAQFNRPKASSSDLLQRALLVLHPDKIKSAVRNQVAADLKKRSKQAIRRPSGHNGKAPSPEAGAINFASQFLRDKAIPDADLESF